MKEFDVTITETLEKMITVKAASQEEAKQMVEAAYNNSEHILDAEDFTGVEFTTQDEREIQLDQSQMMDVLLVKPGMYPQQVKISTELEDMQAAVGGDIEEIYPFEDEVAIVCNGEGKLNRCELNRSLRTEDGDISDILAGDFLITGLTEDDFGSLSPELMAKYEEMFHQPESFVRMGKSIMAIPIPDEKVKSADTPIKSDAVPHKSNPDRDSL